MAKKSELTDSTEAGTVAPKFKMRGKQSIFHHLFRAGLANFLKNQSWVKGVLKIEEVPHVHHYHSVNSMGMKQQFTTTVGGHFHEVKWEINAAGDLVATCGPALKKIVKATPKGQKTEIVPVKFYDGENERYVEDQHKHVMEYQGTDELTPDMVRETREGTAKTVQAMAPKTVEGFVDGDR